MSDKKKNLLKIFTFFKKNYLYILGGILLFGIFFINTFHESYPDEFDNILGGKYILEGKIIYKDFFTHHGPVAYFLAAGALLFSGNSFVQFRIVYSVFLFLLTIGGYLYVRHSVGHRYTRLYIPLLFIIGVTATYFWGHMLLADSISAFFLLPVFALLLLKSIYEKRLTFWDAAFISTFTALALLSSLSYAYLTGFLYMYVVYYFFRSNSLVLFHKKSFKKLLKLGGILIAPVILFCIYLLATWSWGEYFYQNVSFNQMYYVYNYPRPEGSLSVNPIRYMVIIMQNFLMNYSVLLVQIKDFNFSFPYNITLALASSSIIIISLFKKKWTLAIFILLMLIFANVRSNPLESKETDYQEAVYMIFSLTSGVFSVKLLYDSLKEKTMELPQKLIFSLLFILISAYGLFTLMYLTRSFTQKAYGKYMGTTPRIYDRPQLAPFLNDITEEGEYTWIGPFEFEELFYTDALVASRYQIFNPGMGLSDRIHTGLIEDFKKNKPKVIWFDKRFYILGRNPEEYGKKFIEYLDKNYYTLYEYRDEEGRQYTAAYPFEERLDIETKLYIRQENIDEMISRMFEKGYVKVEES